MRETPPLPPCDAVFRGGITSGVVYPGFVATLAAKYRFVRIGGASAGAIAAGLTAAAEYGRRTGAVPDAFEKLAATAKDVGGGDGAVTNLGKLFQPTKELSGLHWLLMRAMALWGSPEALRALARRAALTAAAALLVLLCLLIYLPPGFAWLLILVVILGGVGGVLWGRSVWRQARQALTNQGFGLCGGTNPDLSRDKADPSKYMETLRREGALADWLHAEIQRLSGRTVGRVPKDVKAEQVPPADRPLTMGDLWGDDPARREIDLLLTTTNLDQQLAHQFPFLEKTRNRLFFREDTLAKVVPPDIVAWMKHAQRQPEAEWPKAGEGFLWLPEPRDLPVLLGVRMSLSFPGLIAAVPLYGHDHDVPVPPGESFTPRRAWFSDGGITSNFPITLFDAPLPRYPTFCITLREATEAEQKARPPAQPKPGVSRNPLVVMANANADGAAPRFLAAEERGLFGFIASILQTARNAQENELMLQPGQRDRIVHVLTTKGQGGLNLDMEDEVIGALSDRGAYAAKLLLERFPPEGPDAASGIALDWRNHRWVRFRASMAAMERLLAQIAAGAAADPQQPPGCGIAALIAAPPDYGWDTKAGASPARAAAAQQAVDRILALAAELEAEAARLAGTAAQGSVFDALHGEAGAPEPRSGLVARPLSLDPRETAIYR